MHMLTEGQGKIQMLKYDTVLWDLDGTLLDFKLSERYALGECLKFHGVAMTEEMLALYSGINECYWERLERGEVEKKELLPGRFREFFRQAGISGIDPDEMQKQYEKELGAKTFYVEDSYEVVTQIKGMGIKQHIVTNGILATQQVKMKRSRLDELVDKVFISDEIGYEKPRREFFDSVFRELADVRKERTLLVGDSLTSDIRGANNAGVDACFYNPKKKTLSVEKGTPVHVAYEIGKLREVLEILKK